MTLIKSKRDWVMGQAIFEYFILTTAVVAVVLFFAKSDCFKGIKSSCEKAFDQAVGEILK